MVFATSSVELRRRARQVKAYRESQRKKRLSVIYNCFFAKFKRCQVLKIKEYGRQVRKHSGLSGAGI